VEAKDVEILTRGLATPRRLETVFAEAPVQPAPTPHKSEMAIVLQHSGKLSRVQPTAGLGNQVEEIIWIRKAPWLTLLESHATLWVQSHPGYRRFDRRGGGVDAAHPCSGELTREKKHAIARAAFDLEHPFRSWHMEHGGSKRG
jgi:hypothetical protein